MSIIPQLKKQRACHLLLTPICENRQHHIWSDLISYYYLSHLKIVSCIFLILQDYFSSQRGKSEQIETLVVMMTFDMHSLFVHQSNHLGLPWWLRGKESACRAGDVGLISESGRCPGEGNSNPLQYSCLGNPMDRGIWWATVHKVIGVGHDLAAKPPQPKPPLDLDAVFPSWL